MINEEFLTKENGLNPKEWNQYLKQAHQRFPSMTPEFFLNISSNDSPNTYELLATGIEFNVDKDVRILDLGCGDGHLFNYIMPRISTDSELIGLDISDSELDQASKFIDGRIRLVNSSAEKMPFTDNSFDHILCHLSIMLFSPIKVVMNEIDRVLKKDGLLSAVVVNSDEINGVFLSVQKAIGSVLQKNYSGLNTNGFGNGRFTSSKAISELFKEMGFDNYSLSFEKIVLRYSIPIESFYDIYKSHYLLALIDGDGEVKIKKELSVALKNVATKGVLNFQYPLLKFDAKKLYSK